MQTILTNKAGLKGIVNAIDKALDMYKYRIRTEDGRMKYAGTGENSWL